MQPSLSAGLSRHALPIAVVFLLLVLSAHAAPDKMEGSLKLLAVSESSSGLQGSIADLSLEIRPGEGRVFLETFPPTKEDTQISMRFAKQVACAEMDFDCAGMDFIYTIRAGPGIIGGPSAGAAAAVLTMSVLSGTPLRDDVAMTGTINSGGIIGPVGGLKSKIKAAAKDGVKVALIPLGTRVYKERLLVTVERGNLTDDFDPEEYDGGCDAGDAGSSGGIVDDIWRNLTNSTQPECDGAVIPDEGIGPGDGPPPAPKPEPVPLVIANFTVPKNGSLNMTRTVSRDIDLVEFGKSIGIEVREVSTLDDALVPYTGKNISEPSSEFSLAPDYVRVMGDISADICDRSSLLRSGLSGQDGPAPQGDSVLIDDASRMLDFASNATARGDHYSAASFCFRANIAIATVAFSRMNLSQEASDEMVEDFERQVAATRASVQGHGTGTMTDLQASMIVLERLDEAQKLLDALVKAEAGSDPPVVLAYVQERLVSAKAWSRFIGSPGASYGVSERALEQSCADKLTEAQERYQYVNYYIPNSLEGVRKSIERASSISSEGSFQRCLHIASLAKAEANLIGSLIGASKDSLPLIFDRKMAVVKSSIARTQSRGNFPILAYSYYEYANSLKDSDLNSAVLFAEYALELSNLDIYFQGRPAVQEASPGADQVTGAAVAGSAGAPSFAKPFVTGFLFGVVMMLLIAVLSRPPADQDL